MNNFKLTPQERDTPLWKKLSAHFDARLSALRLRNDNPKLTDAETAALRGRISEVKELLCLSDEGHSLSIDGDMQ